jgi:hypothetical protein
MRSSYNNNKKLESIDDKGKFLLFKTLKTEYKLEVYLKYPDNAIRKLICQFISAHSLGKDRLIKEPKDFTCCEEVGLRIFSILSISFNVLILDRYRKSSRKAVLNLLLIVQYKKKCASSSIIPRA